MVTMAMIGVGLTGATPLAMAQQSSDVDIERNNEIEQSIEQSQQACTNEAEVSVSDDDVVDIGGENEAEVDQSNECIVVQSQSASNNAAIEDNSENTFDVDPTPCFLATNPRNPNVIDTDCFDLLPDFP